MSFAVLPARAQVKLGWGDSPTNGGLRTQVFDCQSNSGASTLVVSIVVPEDIHGVTGFAVDLRALVGNGGSCDDFSSNYACWYPPLPPYWDLRSNGCHAGAFSAAAGFPGARSSDSSSVLDPWQDGLDIQLTHPWELVTVPIPVGSPWTEPTNNAICGVEGVFREGVSVELLAGHEYYLGTFTFRRSRTALPGGCAGCCTPVEFHVTNAQIMASVPLTAGGGGVAYWQGLENYNCSVVATRRSTWGALKSAYR